MLKRLSETSVQLCGKGKCCPIITKLDDGNYEVLDDFGNKIVVKKEELEMVSDAVKSLDAPPQGQLICG
jgi:hypothetical protein